MTVCRQHITGLSAWLVLFPPGGSNAMQSHVFFGQPLPLESLTIIAK